MNEKTSPGRRYPSIVKDQNVPFDRRPSKQLDLKCIEEIVKEHPEEIKGRRRGPGCLKTIVVNEPWNDCQFIDQTEEEKDDNDMIVQSTTKCSIREKAIESDQGERERVDIGDEKTP